MTTEIEVPEIQEDELLKEEIEELEAEVTHLRDGFHVVDSQSADWVVKKALEAQDDVDRLKAQYQVNMRKAQRRLEFFSLFREQEMEYWLRSQLNGKTRSIGLEHGTIGLRHVSWGVDIVDEQEAIASAERVIPNAVQIKKSLLKKELKKHIEDTGEVIDGCSIKPEYDKFYIQAPRTKK